MKCSQCKAPVKYLQGVGAAPPLVYDDTATKYPDDLTVILNKDISDVKIEHLHKLEKAFDDTAKRFGFHRTGSSKGNKCEIFYKQVCVAD